MEDVNTSQGENANKNQFTAGSGGGGSFVWLASDNSAPLVAAGGGGGAGGQQGTSHPGVDGTTSTTGPSLIHNLEIEYDVTSRLFRPLG